MQRALITGVLGQDGTYLTELLKSKGYALAGLELAAPPSPPTDLELFIGDVADEAAVDGAVRAFRPTEIYHLAGQTSVARSFDDPAGTFRSTAAGTLHVLEAARRAEPKPRVLVASSGEIFGNTGEGLASETTAYRPVSPYGAAKAAAAHLTTTYRDSFGVHACLAYFYNHESPRRPPHFVTRKIVRAACRIARGLEKRLELGNTTVVRDWGFAPEYAEAAWRMLARDEPEDFVIATGESCSLEDFVNRAFACVGLEARDFVSQNATLLRPSEIRVMRANPAKAATRLGWQASVHVDALIGKLVAAENAALDRETAGQSAG